MTSKTAGRFEIERTVRQHIRRLTPYTPNEPFEIMADRIGKPIEQVVKLDANENLYRPAPVVLKQLSEMKFSNIYPDPGSRKIKVIAEWIGFRWST